MDHFTYFLTDVFRLFFSGPSFWGGSVATIGTCCGMHMGRKEENSLTAVDNIADSRQVEEAFYFKESQA
eukprot:6051223-Amphidinium_carterae.1